MTPQIVKKLQGEIKRGLNRESQVVYLLAGIRKIIEQERTQEKYRYLKFHCDWSLHVRLRGEFAQHILALFESAQVQVLKGEDVFSDVEVDKISKLTQFREELSSFLMAYGITNFTCAPNKWGKFMCLYGRIIQDCPLIIRDGSSGGVREVVVSVEMAKRTVKQHQMFKVSWRIKLRNGNLSTIFVINSFRRDRS